jgi:hypothetical protein
MINRRHVVTLFPLGAIVLTTLSLTFPVLAQQQQPPASNLTSQTPSPQQQPPSGESAKDDKNKSQNKGTSNDRLFFTLPNFLTVENAGKIPPLTSGQ